MEENRKIKLSKRLFHEALIEMLEKMPLSKISVSALCARADLNRSTFYAHYEDIYALMREIEADYLDTVMPPYIHGQHQLDVIRANTAYTQKNKAVFLALYHNGYLTDEMIRRSLDALGYGNVRRKHQVDSHTNVNSYALMVTFCVSGMLKTMEEYLTHPSRYKTVKFNDMLAQSFIALEQISIMLEKQAE